MDWKSVFVECAAETRAGIRLIRQRAQHQVQPWLDYIENNVFDQKLSYRRIRRACSCNSNGTTSIFRQATGLPPMKYVRQLRMQTAEALLKRSPKVDIVVIAEAVGYTTAASFGRAFTSWAGKPPGQFRREQATEAGAALTQNPVAGQRIDQRKLGFDEFQALIDFLIAQYPEAAHLECMRDRAAAAIVKKAVPAPSSVRSTPLSLDPEEAKLEALWEKIKKVGEREQLAIYRNEVTLPVAFDALCGTTRKAGRVHRQFGVVAARDLQELMEKSSYRCGGKSELVARSWAWLGKAHRLAADLPAARQALDEARHSLPSEPSLSALGEYYSCSCGIYKALGELGPAMVNACQAIEVYRKDGKLAELIYASQLKAIIHWHRSESRMAIPHLLEAAELLKHLGPHDAYLDFVTYQLLVTCYCDCKEPGKAREFLARARLVAESANNSYLDLGLSWLEGRVSLHMEDFRTAETRLLLARQGFLARQAVEHAAWIALDLALLCVEVGRHKEAVVHAADALPFFAAQQDQPEGLAAFSLLQRAVEGQAVTDELIRQVWREGEKLSRDPSFQLDEENPRI